MSIYYIYDKFINNQRNYFPNFWKISIIFLLLIAGCSSSNQPQSNSINSSVDLTISAAASIQDALKAIKEVYEDTNKQVTITYNFGSSGSLQRQIEQGAPVDIFISAAPEQMDILESKNLLLPDTRENLFKNKIVLIVPKNNNNIQKFEDLSTDALKQIALGEPISVPAGKYAKEVLTSLGLSQQVMPKAVYAKDVRQVLNYVATGNVDAGIVYLSDTKVSNEVKVVTTAPENAHSPVVYPIAILKDSKNKTAAKKLKDFLVSKEAKVIFEEYGFTIETN